MNRPEILRRIIVAAGMLLSSFAHAHSGIGEAGGFMHGFAHPFGGWDHLCAMLAVGLWAVQMGGRSVWAVPLAFAGTMALGGALPAAGIVLPFAEQGIVLSVMLLGMLIAAAVRLPLWLGGGIVALFALWHGHAHGVEMPAAVSGMAYVGGFVLATALLHIIGLSFGHGMHRLTRQHVVRFSGAGIAVFGFYLLVV